MKRFFLLLSLCMYSEGTQAIDFEDACIQAILRGDIKNQIPVKYNSEFNILVEYSNGSQWVYLDTGMALTDISKNKFDCTPNDQDPSRDLGVKMNQVFGQIHVNHPNKEQYVNTLLTPCRKTSYSNLKDSLNALPEVSGSTNLLKEKNIQ